jgi:mRNA-degrading endonuclease toxin of MazEF toxin-antitoxin module
MKRFTEWIGLKTKLHEKAHTPPLVSQGDVWWINIGENIGSEVNGKSEQFSRPALIFKKFAHGFYFVIPTSTQTHTGSWYVPFRLKDRDTVACLHQGRSIDYRRLSSKVGTLTDTDFMQVKEGFRNLYSP